jgi:hypothetical protein
MQEEQEGKLLRLMVGAIGFEPTTPCAQGRCKPFFNNLAVGNKRFSAVLQAQSALITANSTANFVSSERKLEWD